MVTTRPLRATLAAATCLALAAFAGCSSDEGDSASDETTASASASTPATSAAATPSETAPESPTGSESGSPLEAYVATAQSQVASLTDSLGEAFSDIRLEAVPPSGIEYLYTFAQAVDPQAATGELESQASVLRSTFQTVIKPEMEAAGITDPTATWTYLNPDGSEVWTKTFPQS